MYIISLCTVRFKQNYHSCSLSSIDAVYKIIVKLIVDKCHIQCDTQYSKKPTFADINIPVATYTPLRCD